MVRAPLFLALAALAAACTGSVEGADSPDGGTAPPPPPAQPDAASPVTALPAQDGDNAVSLPADGEAVYSVDTVPGDHVSFALTFDPALDQVVMSVDRLQAGQPVELAVTDGGSGIRVLAVLDPDGPATFHVRVASPGAAFTGTLAVTRTPFEDGLHCTGDCDHLLQLPLPNDPLIDGYTHAAGTIFRYQFGRRDMVMFIRYAGRKLRSAGLAPFLLGDISQWDGMTPGVDVDAPRHVSHQRGKDVDICLYGLDGRSFWRSFCTAESTADGVECIPGTLKDLDASATARLIGAFYDSGRVTMDFLDRELIGAVAPAAADDAAAGLIDQALVPLYSDGKHLQHWPNHNDHVHIRLSEEAYGTGKPSFQLDVPFEAP